MPHRWDPMAPPVTGLVKPVRIDPTGTDGPTRKQVRGPHWRTSSAGLFVPATVSEELVEQRILEAAARGGDRVVVTGWASLRLQGAGFCDGLARDGMTRLPVPIAANGERLGSMAGCQVLRDTVPEDEVVVVHGIRCTIIERALYDEMQRHHDLREMAVAVGAVCAAKLTSVRRMRTYATTRRWYRDVRIVSAALEMAVERARSPQEDRFRLVWEFTAGWGRPLLNRQVLDLDGRPLGTPDLLDVERGVVGEFAGADHRDIDQHEADIEREADLRGVGLEYVGRDLRHEERIVKRMREAEARAGLLPKRWKLGPPPPSLDEILDARDRRVT
jgi:hypothetical protein